MAINYLELIDGMKFPATRAEIVEYALENDASHEALDAFRAMPQQHFPTLAHVSRAVGLLDRLPGDADVQSQQAD
ncbi:MAG TPA: DUF2795 domain-containing protein [Alphaproteobacteria bacterium]|jgi:hypothetical protein|nr:DUF2795 domain-containing protein [Micavibrio sp.]MBK9561713.1 DUF2795 domain-containing protein [Micavibrio sp.]MBP7721307.1 DUF2795 domain-containing protein [Alphaproteobacteria bacterium]HQX28265.1 DUF2795 domain-containing protein [Alphaproteobacteria bacterium]